MLNRANGSTVTTDGKPFTLLTITGQTAKIEGKFDIADSLQIECEISGEVIVGGQLVIGERGVVNANVQTVDAVIQGSYEGNMIATGTVEIEATGRVTGNVETDSLIISKGGFFNGNVVRKSGPVTRVPVYRTEERRPGAVLPLEAPRTAVV